MWINFKDEKPPINENVLVYIFDIDFDYDIGRWNGDEKSFCHGWDTNGDLTKYRKIKYWQKLDLPPKISK